MAGNGVGLSSAAAAGDRAYFEAVWEASKGVARVEVRLPSASTASVELGSRELAGAVAGLIPGRPHGADSEIAIRLVAADQVVGLPPLPWALEAVIARGDVPTFGDGDLRASQRHGGRVVSMLDLTTNRAVMVVPDADTIPVNELAAPLRPVLSWWLSRRGFGLLHAGCVAGPSGAVIIGGRSHAGKSTLSLAGAAAGLEYLGDDYVALSDGPLRVHAVYRTGHLEAGSLEMLSGLRSAVTVPPGPATKAVLVFGTGTGVSLRPEAPVAAIVLPDRQPGAPAQLSPVTRVEALAALAPSSVIQFPGGSPTAFGMIADLVRQVPAYRLVYGDAVVASGLLGQLTG